MIVLFLILGFAMGCIATFLALAVAGADALENRREEWHPASIRELVDTNGGQR